jgi:endonuclease III
MNKNEVALKSVEILRKEFPNVETPLNHKNVFQLLVGTILSPQTPDETTNKVTPEVFKKYPTVYDLVKANVQDLEKMIKNVNYNKTKAKHLVNMAKMLIEKFNGEVPKTLEELIELPGVGRKVGNVVLSEWFARRGEAEPEGFVVDTHVKRVSFRLGLTKETDPSKVEKDLLKLFPKSEWIEQPLRFIFHGKKKCKSQKPLCEKCPLKDICPRIGVK